MDCNKKEYGGYLEIERMQGSEFYSDLHRLNLGRTAFVWLLDHIKHNRVFLPEFICDTVTESAEGAGYSLVSYRLDEKLNPVWSAEGEPQKDDIFYLVNYNGILRDETIKAYRDLYNSVIVDNAQAFYNKPVDGVHTLYSVRKFFGVADGAYVASDIKNSEEELPQDRSAERAIYLAGRFEGTANEFYADSKNAELGFSGETPKQMSLFTQNMLKAIDYNAVREQRCSNYKNLDALLKNENPFSQKDPVCPYLYPFYHKNGVQLRKYLVANKVYVPTLWEFLLDERYKGTLEQEWSSNITWLPIDQRYDKEDMKYIADLIANFRAS